MNAERIANALPQGNGELILIADDEAPVRQLVSKLLGRNGYRTILAVDGLVAVNVFTEKQDEIAAVILDLVMPEMTGAQAMCKMRELVPDLPVLTMSGAVTVCPPAGDRLTVFLRKPPVVADLLAMLRELLDEADHQRSAAARRKKR